MHRAPAVTTIFVVFLLVGGIAITGAWQSAVAQGSAELAGGWIVTGRTSPAGESVDPPGRGLYIFTESGHYSIMRATQGEPRPQFSGDGPMGTPTDEEKVVAFDNFIANSGRYRVSGDEITYEAYMAKNPNYMAAFNAQDAGNASTMTFSLEGGTLTLTAANGSTVTLRRPGQR